jgi:hypothetical protein
MKTQVFREALEFVANSPKTARLKAQNFLVDIILFIAGRLTIAGGAVSGAAVEDNPFTILKNIALKNGSTALLNIRGEMLKMLNYYDYGVSPVEVPVASGNIGVYDFSGMLKLNVQMLRTIAPESLSLEMWKKDDLLVELTFGTVEDLVLGGDRTKTLSAVTVSVSTNEETSRKFPYPQYPEKRLSYQERTLAANFTGEVKFEIPRGNQVRRIQVIHLDGPVRANLADNDRIEAILDNSAYPVKNQWNALYNQDKGDYGLEVLQKGVLNLDFDESGDFTGLIDTSGQNRSFDLKLYPAVSSPQLRVIKVITEEIIPAPPIAGV